MKELGPAERELLLVAEEGGSVVGAAMGRTSIEPAKRESCGNGAR